MKKSPLLAKIKFEPTFSWVLWRFAESACSLATTGEPSQRVSQTSLLPTGGECGSRTHDGLATKPALQAGAIDH